MRLSSGSLPHFGCHLKKTILITGVSSGIGLAMARKFLKCDYRVIGSVRTSEKADAARSLLGPDFVPLVFDLNEEEQIRAAREPLAEAMAGSPLTALINNAGYAEMAPLLHVPLDEFRTQLSTLVVGQLAVIQQFFEFLRPAQGQPAGRIVNISSVSGTRGNPLFGCYSAGKHALEGLSKSLRKELERYHVPVLVIAPGNIKTSIWEKQTKELAQKYEGTEYHESLLGLLDTIESSLVKNAMTSAEFADALYEIFELKAPAERYTVVKGKKGRLPFGKARVTWTEG